ncbi:MAG: ABC transporter ATP-binding protein [Actinomycetota bacterium]|nr:ABC transporter ATP-binding protein [Actinomycetota bacterium]
MTDAMTPGPTSEDPVLAATGSVPNGPGEPPALDATHHASALLRVSDVRKVYGEGHTEVVAVADATMAVDQGEFVALLGPSGSGKTTLISIVGGLLSPSGGTVTLGGIDVTGLSKKDLTAFRAEQVGFVFQSANLVPFLTARENLLYVASLVKGTSRAQAQARADDLLEELGLAGRAKNLPEQLSGGERQRVAIGRALMNDPDLVLVDEPTAALDTAMGRQVVELLRREIKGRGKTGIMVTHDLRMVEYTDRVFEILDGHLTHVEEPSALRH